MDTLEDYWIRHKVSERITKLADSVKQMAPPEIKPRWDAIDRDITRGMMAAEKKVKGSGQQKYLWSEELDAAGYRL